MVFFYLNQFKWNKILHSLATLVMWIGGPLLDSVGLDAHAVLSEKASENKVEGTLLTAGWAGGYAQSS